MSNSALSILSFLVCHRDDDDDDDDAILGNTKSPLHVVRSAAHHHSFNRLGRRWQATRIYIYIYVYVVAQKEMDLPARMVRLRLFIVPEYVSENGILRRIKWFRSMTALRAHRR